MEVQVIRSDRRRKMVEAREIDGVVRVSIPGWMTKAEEDSWVAKMVARFERRRTTDTIDLAARAAILATRYKLDLPVSISWADNQLSMWGSCTPSRGTIRISSRLAQYPPWVLDYVIVHELAHLAEDSHNPAFWRLVNRYPRTERARGFLIGIGLDGNDEVVPNGPSRSGRNHPAGHPTLW